MIRLRKPGLSQLLSAWLALLCLCAALPVQAAVPVLEVEDTVFLVETGELWSGAPCCSGRDRLKIASPEPEPSAPAPTIEVDLDVALVSDFRRGGISSSNGKPALQADFSVAHRSGLYAGLWASNLAENGGANLEIDALLGYNFGFGPFDAGVGAIVYIFPGVPDSSYVELQAAVAKPFGAFELEAALAYTPRQANTGNRDNIYAGLTLEWASPQIPLTLAGAIGIEDGAFGNSKLDWSVSAQYDLKLLRLGAAYVDAARTSGAAHSDAALVFSAARSF